MYKKMALSHTIKQEENMNCFVTINVESKMLGEDAVPSIYPLSRILKIAPRGNDDLYEVHLSNYNNQGNEIIVTRDSSEEIFSTATFVPSTASFVNATTSG